MNKSFDHLIKDALNHKHNFFLISWLGHLIKKVDKMLLLPVQDQKSITLIILDHVGLISYSEIDKCGHTVVVLLVTAPDAPSASLFLKFLVSLFSPVRSILKRPKLAGAQSNVRFDQVTVFSFPRCQGFTSVPSRGGATLGMMQRHSALQRYTVAEHALERRHRRRERLRERLREDRFKALKHKVSALHFNISLHCSSTQQSPYFIYYVDSS